MTDGSHRPADELAYLSRHNFGYRVAGPTQHHKILTPGTREAAKLIQQDPRRPPSREYREEAFDEFEFLPYYTVGHDLKRIIKVHDGLRVLWGPAPGKRNYGFDPGDEGSTLKPEDRRLTSGRVPWLMLAAEPRAAKRVTLKNLHPDWWHQYGLSPGRFVSRQVVPDVGRRGVVVVERSRAGDTCVEVAPLGVGSTLLYARDGQGKIQDVLEVTVKEKRILSVLFHYVVHETQGTERKNSDVDEIIKKANEIYLPQANIEFRNGGFPRTVNLTGQGIDFGGPVTEEDADKYLAPHKNSNRDINVFFIKTLVDSNHFGRVSRKTNIVLISDKQSDNGVGWVFGHEAGHFLTMTSPRGDLVPNAPESSDATTLMFGSDKFGGTRIRREEANAWNMSGLDRPSG